MAYSKKKIRPINLVSTRNVHRESSRMLSNLESAWNNLPDDMDFEEREIFLEITERMLRMYAEIKNSTSEDADIN